MELRLAHRAQEDEKAAQRKHEKYGKTTVRAIGDAVVVKPVEARKFTDAGIEMPHSAVVNEMKRGRGIVVDIGPGPMGYEGALHPMPNINIGDEIVYNGRLICTPDGDAGYEFHVVQAKNVCGVIVRAK